MRRAIPEYEIWVWVSRAFGALAAGAFAFATWYFFTAVLPTIH